MGRGAASSPSVDSPEHSKHMSFNYIVLLYMREHSREAAVTRWLPIDHCHAKLKESTERDITALHELHQLIVSADDLTYSTYVPRLYR
jgi:hypothetical protein